jgi:hypothetical protein
VVTKLDRLEHLVELSAQLQQRGVDLVVPDSADVRMR